MTTDEERELRRRLSRDRVIQVYRSSGSENSVM